MGAAAVLLQSNPKNCKYQVVHRVRTHTGADDVSFNSMMDTVDEKGNYGVKISKDMAELNYNALQANLSKMFQQEHKPEDVLKKVKQNVKHYCFHTGDKAVLDLIQ